MENEDVIRDQMEDTRTSLTEKLETLEQKVVSTVEAATANVAETVEAVKDSVQDTVSTVKDTVQDTITSVKSTVHESVTAVKDAFDVSAHFERYPWLMLGGSVAVGFVIGKLVFSATAQSHAESGQGASDRSFRQDHEAWEREGSVAAETAYKRSPLAAMPNGHNGHTDYSGFQRSERSEDTSSASKGAGMIGGWLKTFAPELEKLKGLAIGALMGTLRETVSRATPDHMREPLADVINSVTEKLGGQPIEPQEPEEHTQGQHQRWASAT